MDVLVDAGTDCRAVFVHDFLDSTPADGEWLLMQYAHFHVHHVRDHRTCDDCLLCVATRFNQSTVSRVIEESCVDLCAKNGVLCGERDTARVEMVELQNEARQQTVLVGSLHDEAAALHAQVLELDGWNYALQLELHLNALKEVIENMISQPPSLTQWNAKLCAEHFHALWAKNQCPLGILIYPYWPETGSSPMNLWIDAATIRGHLLFECIMPRSHNPHLFTTALLIGLEPVKYYAYVNSNAQRWTIGDKLDCGKVGNTDDLAVDMEVVMQIWTRCSVTPEHTADAFKYTLYFTFEAYMLHRLPDFPCPMGLLNLYETAHTVDIYGRGPNGATPLVKPWQAWVPPKVSSPGTTWTSNQLPPPEPAIPMWPADMDERAPIATPGYVHNFAGTGQCGRVNRGGGLFYGHNLEPGQAPAYYGEPSVGVNQRTVRPSSIPPMPSSRTAPTISFMTVGHNDDMSTEP
ncbi:hypothetical protein K488DRAFT_74675 [Vararia minispora EC-137]|uniref:Uncharacterized protein n=1 Tax=Vararia minispora EC-137 TaxID=1314806 RepID=A0ACB8Q6I6_9AGAM|nr:hypothetical protein K488DRAFT_74675 [Vararia minispora EC-137]